MPQRSGCRVGALRQSLSPEKRHHPTTGETFARPSWRLFLWQNNLVAPARQCKDGTECYANVPRERGRRSGSPSESQCYHQVGFHSPR